MTNPYPDNHFLLWPLLSRRLTTSNEYEFVIYRLETSLTPETGEIAEEGLKETDSTETPDPNAHVWRYASIHVYPSKPSVPRDLAADALVQYGNFTARTETERLEKALHAKFLIAGQAESEPLHSQSAIGDVGHKRASGKKCLTSELVSMSEPPVNVAGTSGESSLGRPTITRSRSAFILPIIGSTELSEALNETNTSGKEPSVISPGNTGGAPSETASQLTCNLCGAKFLKLESLRGHEERKVCAPCPTCGKYFKAKELVEAHRKKYHGDDQHLEEAAMVSKQSQEKGRNTQKVATE
ncbi:hypothetical protein G7Y89_g7632 [Cudoniella acicularis]|uniref:C2H2-type domain-containing protein n=1 Tax=Cudoniella acicularis TaxID=354080 RepID=A0A8H4W1V9_9HELO|nr:hypothetical protein G7Y89_g7632 [Cudoniella acicularis]